MKKTILMRGLPGSGKSSRASKQEGFIIFSRDTARLQNPSMNEDGIRNMEREFVLQGYQNIIVDNTHMNEKSLESIKLFCQGNGYQVEVHDMFDETSEGLGTSYYHSVCSARNKQRQGRERVPQSVIDEMFLSNYNQDSYDNIDKYVIVDIDGTIADNNHRVKYIKEKPKNWKKYEDLLPLDKPINPVISLISSLQSDGYTIVLLTGRKSKECYKTIKWMNKYNVSYDYILMRSDWDGDPDYVVKEKLYKKCLANKEVLFALEDRQRNMDMWKRNGLFVVNVNQQDPNF